MIPREVAPYASVIDAAIEQYKTVDTNAHRFVVFLETESTPVRIDVMRLDLGLMRLRARHWREMAEKIEHDTSGNTIYVVVIRPNGCTCGITSRGGDA